MDVQGFEFMANLTGDSQDVSQEFIGLALYENPTRLLNRHNEIWLWSIPKPSASSSSSSADDRSATASASAAVAGAAKGMRTVVREAVRKVSKQVGGRGDRGLAGGGAVEGLASRGA